MIGSFRSFVDEYVKLFQFAAVIITIGLGSHTVIQKFSAHESSAFLLEEQRRMAQHQVRPTEYYVTYHNIKIEGRSKKDGKTVFKMNSDVSRDKQQVRMTWRDTAAFRDADNELIERNSPCQQVYPMPGLPTADCTGTPSDGWYQHQWWRGDMPKKDKRSWEPWTYTQKTIPPNAASIQVCGFYEIRVYKGFIGEVDKIMNVCTRWYDLKDIPEVSE